MSDVIRIHPFQFVHVLDLNTNIERLVEGPKNLMLLNHQQLVAGPLPMIVIPPGHYCVINDPLRTYVPGVKCELDVGNTKVKFHGEPFPLYPGEYLSSAPNFIKGSVDYSAAIKPLPVVKANCAIRLLALVDHDDNAIKRMAGDKWQLTGPLTYKPRSEVQIQEIIESVVIKSGQVLKLKATQDTVDNLGNIRVTGEEWLVKKPGAYLPGVFEEVVKIEEVITLTSDVALHLKALQTLTDLTGKMRQAGEEWLLTCDECSEYTIQVGVEVVETVKKTVVKKGQYAVILNPINKLGKPQLGQKEHRIGLCSFFLHPGEFLEGGKIQSAYLLSEDDSTILQALENYDESKMEETKITRQQFTLGRKLEILAAVDSGKKKKNVAKEFGISPSTLSTFLKGRKKIEEMSRKVNLGPQRKRMLSAPFEDVEKTLYMWLCETRSSNIHVTGPAIQKKAKVLACQLGHKNFIGSSGWLKRFRDRYKIPLKAKKGNESSPTLDKVKALDKVKEVISSYMPEDIYNADEMGVYYQLLPHHTLTVTSDKDHRSKDSQQRLTILLCCNAIGTHKIQPLIIGKTTDQPRLKDVTDPPCEYVTNQHAWMTPDIFGNWVQQLDKTMKNERRKILLLVDTCAAHNLLIHLENIQIEHLPSNIVSDLQPLNLGIIKSLKVHYRMAVLQKIFTSGNYRLKINIKEAIEMFSDAWSQVKENTIVKCWHKSVFNSYPFDNEDQKDPLDSSITELWNSVTKKWPAFPHDKISFQDYVNADNNLLVSADLTEPKIMKTRSPNDERNLKDSCDDDNGDSDDDNGDSDDDNGDSDDDDNDSDGEEKTTGAEALAGFKKVKKFLSCSVDANEKIFSLLKQVEDILLNTIEKSSVRHDTSNLKKTLK